MTKRILLSIVIAAVLVGMVRLLCLAFLTISGNGQEPVLMGGDRVVVWRWAYGYRTPLSSAYGYHRWCAHRAKKGDWVLYNTPKSTPDALPDTSALCVGRCLAVPGDTVWMGTHGKVSARKSYSHGRIWPMVVPAKGSYVKLTPWNVRLYATTIQQHEDANVTLQGDSVLLVGGRAVTYYRFMNDYYWMQNGNESNFADSRIYGFVPSESLNGRLLCILYSLSPQQPWLRKWLWNRMGKPIMEEGR